MWPHIAIYMNCNFHELQFTKCNFTRTTNHKLHALNDIINCNLIGLFFHLAIHSSSFSSSCGPRKRLFFLILQYAFPSSPTLSPTRCFAHFACEQAGRRFSALTVTSLDLSHAQKCDCNMPPFSHPMSAVLSSTN